MRGYGMTAYGAKRSFAELPTSLRAQTDGHAQHWHRASREKWLFVFNSNFLRAKEDNRSPTPLLQSFDRPPPRDMFNRSRGIKK
jgi:hypothetical protein